VFVRKKDEARGGESTVKNAIVRGTGKEGTGLSLERGEADSTPLLRDPTRDLFR
jgi:hypothetical protein